MNNTASILVNDTHKLFRDFDIQMDHLISAKQLDLLIINKKQRTGKIVDFADLADHRGKLKVKRRIITRTLPGNWRTIEHENDNSINYHFCFWYCHERIKKRIGGLGNKKTRGDHPNYCIIEIGQNTKKSPRDLRRLAVTQTQVKDHQLTLILKTQGVNNNDFYSKDRWINCDNKQRW